MGVLSKTSNLFSVKDRCQPADPDQSGSVLIYIVVVMLIFGFLGAGMVSLFTSSTMMSSGIPNHARDAEYLAEAGMRYAISELRNNGYTKGTISTLNSTTYTLDDAGSFTLNVLGKWFTIDQATHPAGYNNTISGTISLDVPQGTFPSDQISASDFDIPGSNIHLVNLESYRDSIIYTGDPTLYTAPVTGVTYSSINIDLSDSFQAYQDEPVCIAVTSATSQTPAAGGNLNLPDEAASFFPEKYGSFYVTNTVDEKKLYYYEEMQTQPSVKLTGLSEGLTVNASDYIILSPRNHMIVAAGSSGSSTSGGGNYYAANYRQNIDTPQEAPPPASDLPEDLDTDTILDGMGTVGASDSGAVDVDTDTDEITLGGGLSSEFGSVFFGGDVSIGGASGVCSGGKCQFNEGFRAFFMLDYNGSGDGFTFAVINGTDNAVGATGGGIGGESLGYAGDGGAYGTGLAPPKMALEFDTYVNVGRDDPDLGTSNRDVLQYVLWGDDQADLDDDNKHDTGGSGLKDTWTTNPRTTSIAVTTKPVVKSSNDYVYVTNGTYLYGFDPTDGSDLPNFRFSIIANTLSSPALDSAGNIVFGDDYNGGSISLVKSDGSGFNWFDATLTGVANSSPAIDSSDVIYFGTDSGYFYAYNSSGSPAKWSYYTGGVNRLRGTPALSPNEATVYFVSENSERLYALNTSDGSIKWPTLPSGLDLEGPIYSSPTVADDGTIYIGSDGASFQGLLFAINPDGTEKWRYTFSPNNPRCKPTIGPDGTIYIGVDDNYLYAITDEETSGSLKWRFQTSDRVHSSPLVHDDGTIWFGSDDNYMYVVDSNGQQIDKFDLYDDVNSAPTQGSDGTVYVGSNNNKVFAYKPSCNPRNIKTRTFSYSDLLNSNAVPDLDPVDGSPDVASSDDWLNSGPWAVRIEIERNETANARGLYEYTLNTWIRQCQQSDCSDITPTYFGDTRIEYKAKDPHIEQTIELCAAEHTKFDTFLYGFTQATGSVVSQTAVISNLNLGFIRPGDAVITSDANW